MNCDATLTYCWLKASYYENVFDAQFVIEPPLVFAMRT